MTTPAIPWLELVPESRVGFLAPELSLRRDLGLVVGSGVHLPLAPGHGLDLRARTGTAGGGAEASIDGSAARVRALLSVRRGARSIATLRGRGAARQGALAVAADVGLLRGPRSAMGAESNERLSEVEDVVAAAAIAGPSTHAGSALELWRPASAGAFSWVAPRAVAGASWSVAGLALEASSEVEADRSGAAWLRPALRVGLSGSAGPLRLSSTASAEARVDGRDGPPGRAVLAGAAARVSLRRTFGEQVHRIVPLVGIGAAGWVRPDASSAGRAVEPLPRGAGILAVAGLSSSLSHLGATWAAADLFVRWPVLSSPEPSALHAVLSLRAPAIQARAAAAWPLSAVGHETGSALPALVSARLSIGPAASRARLDLGLLHTDWRGRSLAIADAREPAPQGASSIARGPVTLVGAELRSPWLGPLAAALGLDVDVAAGELTRVRGELALRDGCLTLTLAGAWALPDDAPTLTLALGGL